MTTTYPFATIDNYGDTAPIDLARFGVRTSPWWSVPIFTFEIGGPGAPFAPGWAVVVDVYPNDNQHHYLSWHLARALTGLFFPSEAD